MRKDFVVDYEGWREFGQSELQKWDFLSWANRIHEVGVNNDM